MSAESLGPGRTRRKDAGKGRYHGKNAGNKFRHVSREDSRARAPSNFSVEENLSGASMRRLATTSKRHFKALLQRVA